jgi:hypothetical protein
MEFPYGLRSAAQIVERHMARCFRPPPMNEEFVGMANYIEESTHDLLTSDLESSLILSLVRGATTPRANVSWQTSSTHDSNMPYLGAHITNSVGRIGTMLPNPCTTLVKGTVDYITRSDGMERHDQMTTPTCSRDMARSRYRSNGALFSPVFSFFFFLLMYFCPPALAYKREGPVVTPGFLKNKTRLIICVPRKSTHMPE